MSQGEAFPSATRAVLQAVWLVLGAHEVLWACVRGKGKAASWEVRARVDVQSGTQSPRRALMNALDSLPDNPFDEATPATALHVWVADHWVAMEVVPWSDAFLQEASALALARVSMSEEGHEVQGGDLMRLDDAPLGQPRLAVAYPHEMLTWLAERAQAWSLRLCSVRVASVACWSAMGGSSTMHTMAVLHDEALVIMCSSSSSRTLARAPSISEFHSVPQDGRAHRLGPETTAFDKGEGQQLIHSWRRLALRFPQWATASELPFLDARIGTSGAVGAAGVPKPFAHLKSSSATEGEADLPVGGVLTMLTRRASPHTLDAIADRRPRLSVWVPVVAALFFGFALVASMVWSGDQLIDTIEGKLAQYRQPAIESTLVNPLTKKEKGRIPAVNQAVRQLNLPVHALLHSLEPPKDVLVAVLSVDSVGRGGLATHSSIVRIVAQSPSSADMMRYVAFVSERKPFTGALLRKHEWVDGLSRKQIRFTVEATWTN